jgi:aminopeptidase N
VQWVATIDRLRFTNLERHTAATHTMTTLRTDYQPYPFQIPTVELAFDLDGQRTEVLLRMHVRRTNPNASDAMILDGQSLELLSVHVNGQAWPESATAQTEKHLKLLDLPEVADIEIISVCHPATNDSLMGLYVSGANLFTQCEAEGFRRICWFADRPDVMSVYTVTLRASKRDFPILLSNGNLVSERDLDNGRHESCWHDPFLKPCYLFALVAGDFECREKTIQTAAGKTALLQIYSDPGSLTKTEWAMQSLERSLRWDATRFGLSLDLDRFMIVAARDFNMGAMENKGLNVFNAAYVMADPETATDANYQAIEAVIGHEYFHNWTGNRVTCRDWFQLSLKEGLTVFRDQEFTADMMADGLNEALALSARAVKRIDDVATLKAAQFPEDAGPMAHPIRPESYQEISNFYTATVYEKGAEVIRMLHTLLGEATFQAGMREYFRRHDGQAVTCDEFVDAMQWAWQQVEPTRDLSVFRRWYSQAGTPVVTVKVEPTATPGETRVTLTQHCPAVGVEKESRSVKQPFHIPFAVGFLQANGKPLTVEHDGQKALTLLLDLTQAQQEWIIKGTTTDAIASLNRGFCAPIQVQALQTNTELETLAIHDTDPLARWDALQSLFARYLLDTDSDACQSSASPALIQLTAISAQLFADKTLDAGYLTRLLTPPSDKYLLQAMSPMDPLQLARRKQVLEQAMGQGLAKTLKQVIAEHASCVPYSPDTQQSGPRAIRNLALGLLCQARDIEGKQLALAQYNHATNMTDRLGSLRALLHYPEKDSAITAALNDFFIRFQSDPLVVDKWFALQACSPGMTVAGIKSLMLHPAFTRRNPNRLRALLFQFCLNNPMGFHAPDGSGYQFWAEQVCLIDETNPEVAARFARALDHWTHHTPAVKSMMNLALTHVASQPELSANTREIVTKALSL